MDVGLNNINNLHKATGRQELEHVEWAIEATNEEQYNLWKNNKEKYKWEQIQTGCVITICNAKTLISINGYELEETLPICVEFSFAKVNGHLIMFYSSNSLLQHWGIIEAFIIKHFQRTHSNYTRWNHTNAVNFHNCAGYLETIDVKPRNTKYDGSNNAKYIDLLPDIKVEPHCTNYELHDDCEIKEDHGCSMCIHWSENQ